MARWIFRQIDESTRQDRASTWIWALEQSHGGIIRQSARSFSDLMLCMDDASNYGYYGGHYDVYVRTDEYREATVP